MMILWLIFHCFLYLFSTAAVFFYIVFSSASAANRGHMHTNIAYYTCLISLFLGFIYVYKTWISQYIHHASVGPYSLHLMNAAILGLFVLILSLTR